MVARYTSALSQSKQIGFVCTKDFEAWSFVIILTEIHNSNNWLFAQCTSLLLLYKIRSFNICTVCNLRCGSGNLILTIVLILLILKQDNMNQNILFWYEFCGSVYEIVSCVNDNILFFLIKLTNQIYFNLQCATQENARYADVYVS